MGTTNSKSALPPPRSLAEEATPKDETDNENNGSGCPMHRADGSYSWDPMAMLKAGFPHGPGGSKPLDNTETSGCPVKNKEEYNVYGQVLNPQNNMPTQPNQLPAPSQSEPLSTDRVASTIPKGGAAKEGSTWTYPSPQMFYNALQRKSKLDGTSERDMDSVVAVHNEMNELTWKQVVEWERVVANNETPKLLKFQGRPSDLSPKAYFKHYILGHTLPFDRHDWFVERPDGSVVRYVLDYYSEAETEQLHVDVRPALDSATALWQRTFTMPSAQSAGTTPYETLPLQPLPALRAAAAVTTSLPQTTNNNGNETTPTSIAHCRAEQLAVEACESDDCVAKASIDLTLCLGRHVCPLQMAALTASKSDQDTEAAFERLSQCVAQKAGRS